MKFLVIRLNALGEVVMTTPLIRCIRKQVPGAEIHFVTGSKYQTILQSNPYLDQVHVYRGNDMGNEDIRSIKPDVIIDLQHSDESKKITQWFDVNTYRLQEPLFRQRLYTGFKLNLLPGRHLVEWFFDAVQPLGISNDGDGLDYFIPPSEKLVEKDIPASHLLGYIAIVIAGSKFNKRMPVEKLREICKAIHHPMMLIGRKKDFDAAYQVSLVDPVKIYNACGKFSLHESADLLQRSKLVIGHDTGLMQVAAALRKPLISVWGSTVPALGRYPYQGKNKNAGFPAYHVQLRNLWCRPCSVNGLDHCPLFHFKCMKKIPVPDLVLKVNAMLKQAQNSNSLTEGW